MDTLQTICFLKLIFRVIPRQKRLAIVGPPNKIDLYIDESIEICFSLLNNLEDCEDLNNVRLEKLFLKRILNINHFKNYLSKSLL